MNKRGIGCFASINAALCAILFFSSISPAYGYQVTDARGKVFDFDRPPLCATIVPAVTQNIYAAGAQKYLLGNSRYCDVPEDAKNKKKLGGFLDPDYEAIVALRPQIFILPTVSETRIEDRLKRFGIPCFYLHGEGLKNISENLRIIGKLFKTEETAEKRAQKIDEMILSATAVSEDSPRAIFMFGKIAAGKGSYVGELLTLCGLKNCADNMTSVWGMPSREFIFTANPQIIFAEVGDENERESIENFYKTDFVWRNSPAAKNGRIYAVPRRLVGVPSARVFYALEFMRKCANENNGQPQKF